ncbi:MAG TPA: hypothetical protein VGI55_10000, partial [Solirubrobacteraceae bacterium]
RLKDGIRARLLARLAIELSYAGEEERRAELSSESVARGRASGDPSALAAALGARHVALWGPDELSERLAVSAEMLALAEHAGDRDAEALARNWRVCDLIELGDHAVAAAEIDAFARLADELRVPRHRWYVPLWRAALAISAGDTTAGRELATEANALGRLAADANADVFLLIQQWMIGLIERRMPADVVQRVEERAANSPVAFEWGFSLVGTYALAGRIDDARRAAAALDAAAMQRLPKDANWIACMCEFVEGLAVLADTGRARLAHEWLAPYADRQATCGRGSSIYGSVAFFAARAAATAGERTEADHWFARAAAHNDQLAAHGMSAQTRWRHGELLLANDHGRAHDLLARAKADAERLGLAHLAADIDATLSTAVSRVSSA